MKKSMNERKPDMENKTNKIPKMMTVRQVVATGLLPESAIRRLLKEKKIAAVYSGKKAFINFDILCDQLANLSVAI
jgi:hypothetical protein